MPRPQIAVVSRDPAMRLTAARAFDLAPSDWNVRLFDSIPEDADVVVVAPDVEEGGIALDVDDPQRTLAAVAAELGRAQTRVIVVCAASGGVGCTSVALHLAAYLSVVEPAVYLEASASCGARWRLGLEEETPHWSAGLDADDAAARAIPIHPGFRALLAPPAASAPARATIELCAAGAHHVVVDAGASVDAREAAGTDVVYVVVMTPSIPAARRTARLLPTLGPGVIVVTNRLGPGSEASDRMLEHVLGRRLTLTLPCSPALRDVEDAGRLLGRDAAAWSRRLTRLADRLHG